MYSATGTFVFWLRSLRRSSCSGVMYTVVEIFFRAMTGPCMTIRQESIEMGTLGGFPFPPAMVRRRQSRRAPHAPQMGTLKGLPDSLPRWSAAGEAGGLPTRLRWEPSKASHSLPRWSAAGRAGGLPTRIFTAPCVANDQSDLLPHFFGPSLGRMLACHTSSRGRCLWHVPQGFISLVRLLRCSYRDLRVW